jgi:hypothetical protein
MAEPKKMVHLTPVQRRRRKFSHPLTDNALGPLTEEELGLLIVAYFGKSLTWRTRASERMVLNCIRLLRSTVARYLAHWTVCRRFMPEMVSTGAEAVVKVVGKLPRDLLDAEDQSRVIGGLVECAIRHAIESEINRLRGVVNASERTNWNREKVRANPVYGTIEANLEAPIVQNIAVHDDIDTFAFELEDALEGITTTGLEGLILEKENWGLSNVEVGKRVGVSPQHVGRVRNYLLERYKKLGEKI